MCERERGREFVVYRKALSASVMFEIEILSSDERDLVNLSMSGKSPFKIDHLGDVPPELPPLMYTSFASVGPFLLRYLT